MKSLIFFSSLAILFAGACKPEDSEHQKNNTNTLVGDPISVDEAKRLVKNFDSHAYKPPVTSESRPGFTDTRCIWFHKDTLLSILKNIETQGGDGIRFYFAAYDKTAEYGCDPDHLDHSTLVLVSTFDKLVPNPDPTKRDSVHKHFDYFGDKKLGVMLTTNPENRGELCPPPQTCISEGALLFEP